MSEPKWYALRGEPKREHFALPFLRLEEIEAFCPRVTFTKPTRRGPVRFVEALFPTYLFARFDRVTQLEIVRRTRGVAGIVHFGSDVAAIADWQIEALRKAMGSELVTIAPTYEPGQTVDVKSGPFAGQQVVVIRALPSNQRLRVLYDLLGGKCEGEISLTDVFVKPRLERIAA